MPQGFADDSQPEIGDDFFADTSNCFDIAKEIGRTAFRIHQPLSANIHDDCSRSPTESLRSTESEFAILTTNGDRLQGEIAVRKVCRR
jgi:hypothetical protein